MDTQDEDPLWFRALYAFLWLSIGTMLAASVVVLACTPAQLRQSTDAVDQTTRIIDIPAVNDEALHRYLEGLSGRVSVIEQRRGGDQSNLSWQEWLYALLGIGGPTVMAARVLDNRQGRARSQSRAALLELLDAVQRGELAPDDQSKRQELIARAGLEQIEQGALDQLLARLGRPKG